ncbi:MAG TPA: hypothetical protein VKX49_09235 [Bryobacteraceae bacterium]|nr:hypothetical protein [Bryobacteraceae bacterium]
MEHPDNNPRNDELGALFAEYKSVVRDPEPSANFMPQLWRRIEARQNTLFRVKRISQMFVAAAAAICILFATMLAVPNRAEVSSSYVDVLAQAYPTENLASHGILLDEADGK